MKIRLSWLITLGVMMVMLAACTGAATSAPEQKPAEEKPAATEKRRLASQR
jgi:hypothetical protein